MKNDIPVEKDENRELAIPTQWRDSIADIVGYISTVSSQGWAPSSFIDDFSEDLAESIRQQLVDFGSRVDPVSSSTWDTSIYRWMNGYWQVLIDLFSGGKPIDLVLFLRVAESHDGYRFRIDSIHVP